MDTFLSNGTRITALRKEAGLTKERLAQLAGCNVKSVSRAEGRGERLSRSVLEEIAEALEEPLSDALRFRRSALLTHRKERQAQQHGRQPPS